MAEKSLGAGLLMGGASYGAASTDPYADIDLTSLTDEELAYLEQELTRQQTPWYLREPAPGEEAPAQEPGFFGDVKDLGVQVLAGVPKAGAGLVELGGLVPGLHYIADPLARGLMAAGEYIEDIGLSDYQKQKSAELSDALDMAVGDLGPDADINDYADAIFRQGGAAADYLAENPGQVLNLIAESIPYIAGGAGAVRTLTGGAKLGRASAAGELASAGRVKRGLGAVAATPGVRNVLEKVEGMSALKRGALGEGLMVTGTTVQGIAEATEDEGYTAGRLLAPLAGLTAYGTGRLGGRIAERLGMEGADVDTLIAKKLGQDVAAKVDPVDVLGTTGFRDTPEALVRPFGTGRTSRLAGTAARMGVGGTLEGVVEELPQSVVEQMVTNVGSGENILKDVGGSAVLGTVAGFGMGAPLGARRTRSMNIERAERAARAGRPMVQVKPAQIVKPANVSAQAWAEVAEKLKAANTREEATTILKEAETTSDRYVDKEGNLNTTGQKIVNQWTTPLDLKKPRSVKNSAWEAVLPEIGDARTQDAVELALRRQPEEFVNAKGQLNKRGREIVLQWQARNQRAEAEGRREAAAPVTPAVAPEPTGAPDMGRPAGVAATAATATAATAASTAAAQPAAPTGPEVTTTVEGGKKAETPLPWGEKSAPPRFGYGQRNYIPNFADPVDRAAYVAAKGKSAKNKDHMAYVKAVTGMTEAEIVAYGKEVHNRIKAIAKTAGDVESIDIPAGKYKTKATEKPAEKETKATKKKKDKDLIESIKKELDDIWTDEAKTAPKKKAVAKKKAAKKEAGQVKFESPASRMAFVLALQGYMPELLSDDVREGTALSRLAALSEELKTLGPNGEKLYDTLVNLHKLLKAREAQVRIQSKEDVSDADRRAAVTADKRLSKQIAKEYATIQELVGDKRLREALRASKSYMSTLFSDETGFLQGKELTEYQTTGLKGIGMDTSAGVRFSTEYSAFTKGELGQQFIRTETYRPEATAKKAGVAGRQVRGKTLGEAAQKTAQLFTRRLEDKGDPTRLADIMDKDVFNGRAKPRHRIATYLDHIAQTGRTGYVQLLARRMKATADKLGVFDPATPNRVQVVLSSKSDPKGRAAGRVRQNTSYDPKAVDGPNAVQMTMEIYQEGMDPITVLHEIAHVISSVAARDPKLKNTHSFKQLFLVAQGLKNAKITVEQVAERYGNDAAGAYKVLTDFARAGNLTKTVAEMIAYGFTEPGLQKLLMDIKTTDGTVYRQSLAPASKDSLWRVFVKAIKTLFGAAAIRDTEFERFMYASNAFLNEIEDQAEKLRGAKGRGSFDDMSKLGARDPAPSAAYDPQAAANNPKVAQKAAKAKAAQQDGAGGVSETQKNAAKERKEKEARRAKTIAESAEVRARRAAEAEKRNTTAVLASGRTSMDVTWLDRTERQVLNGLSSMFGGSGDYQADVEKVLAMGRDKLQAFLKADPEKAGYNPIQRAIQSILNAMGAGIVSNYGQPEALREKLHKLSAAFYGLGAEFSVAVQDIGVLPREQQAAIIQYLETGEEANLRAVITNKQVADNVLKLAKRLETLFEDAKAAGLVEYALIKEGVDAKVIDFLKLYNDPAEGKMIRQSVRKMGLDAKLPEGVQYATMSEVANSAFALNKDGDIPSSFSNPTVRYYKLLNSAGEAFFVDTRASNAVVDRMGLVPDPAEVGMKYRVRGVNNDGDVTFVRSKSAEELATTGEDKYLDNVVASMAVLGQNIGRVIENRKFFDSMIAENASMKVKEGEADPRWIIDGMPSDVDKSRVTKLTLEQSSNIMSLTKKMFGKGHIALRAPGYWVTIPEDASDARWNGLVGKTVSAPVFSGILDMYDARPMVDSKLWRMVNTFWKKNVTVYAPVAHMNNIMGNFVLAYAHDIPAGNIKQGVRLTMIKNLTPAQLDRFGIEVTDRDRALLKEISDAGIELITFRYGDLDTETKEDLAAAVRYMLRNQDNDASKVAVGKASVALENVFAALKKTDETFTKAYSEQDNIFRIAGYITHFQNANRANSTAPASTRKSVEQMKDEAGRFARSAFVDYDIKAPWVNAMRHGKFGGIQLPFVSWTYRMVPIMAKIAVTKPWKIANIIGGVYALNMLSYAMLGGGGEGDERREKELTLVPDYWSKGIWGFGPPGFIRMPFGEGESGYIYNLGNAIPLSNIFDWREGENLPGALMPGGAGLTAIQAIFNYDFFRRKEISPEFGGSEMWGGDVMGYLWSQNTPRIMVDAWRLGNDAVAGKKNALGGDPNRWVQLAKVMGFNVREVNWQEQELYRGIEIKKMQRDAKAAVNKLMREYYRNGSEPDTAEIYERVNEIYETLDKKTREKLGVE